MVDWNYDTIRQIAMQLTVDKAGKDATDPASTRSRSTSTGFEPQRDDLRGHGRALRAGRLACRRRRQDRQIPDAWAAAGSGIYNGIWTDHFILTGPDFNSQTFNGGGYAFNSGQVAMSENFLWSRCCVTDAGGNWNLAAIPSYNGQSRRP